MPFRFLPALGLLSILAPTLALGQASYPNSLYTHTSVLPPAKVNRTQFNRLGQEVQAIQGVLGLPATSGAIVRTTAAPAVNEIPVFTGAGVAVGTSGCLSANGVLSCAAINQSSGLLRIPAATTLPATCVTGDISVDIDAVSGQRLYLCESTNTWVKQGDGVGGGGAGGLDPTLIDTSVELAAIVTDETGSGPMVFGTAPTLTSAVLAGTSFVPGGAMLDVSSGAIRVPVGIALPGACTTGQAYLLSGGGSASLRFYLCTSTNTWSVVGSDGLVVRGIGSCTPDANGNCFVNGAVHDQNFAVLEGNVNDGNQTTFRLRDAGGGAATVIFPSGPAASVRTLLHVEELPAGPPGALLLAETGSEGRVAYSTCTADADEITCPADAAVGGALQLFEGADDGTDVWTLQVPDNGLSAPVTFVLLADGRFPNAALQTGVPRGSASPFNCAAAVRGAQFFDTDLSVTCFCSPGDTWCRNDTAVCGTNADCNAGVTTTTTSTTTTSTVATTTTTSTTTTTTVVGSYQAPVNWTSSMLAVWNVEEAADANRDNAEGTAARDLVDNTTTARTTTGVRQGTYALDCDNGTDYLRQTTAPLLASTVAPLTMGGWMRPENDDGDDDASVSAMGSSGWLGTGLGGAWLEYNEISDKYIFSTGNNTGAVNQNIPTTTRAYDTITHVVGVIGAGETSTTLFLDGVLGDTNTGLTDPYVPTDDIFSACRAGTYATFWAGQQDELFLDDTDWTVDETCRVARCGIAGELCMCDGTTPANYLACTVDADCRQGGNTTALCDTSSNTCRGRGSSLSVTCTPPSCNVGAPS